jgi:D-lactate dehydrogenase
MKVAVFSTKVYDRRFLQTANERYGHQLTFLEAKLAAATAGLAAGHDAVCAFVNDDVSADSLEALRSLGIRLITLRSAGFNHVDLVAAERLEMTIARVPAYSPHAVAEHAIGLLLTLNRKFHRAYNRVREGNFSLDGLVGFDLYGKTVGVAGTGKIGTAFCRILRGFGCRIVALDPYPNDECRQLGVEYVDFGRLLAESHIISLHLPLTPETHHLIDAAAIERMRPGVVILNTSRGGLVDTRAVIAGLKTLHIGYLGLDVYEEEADLFFQDLSGSVLQDDVFARLLSFPNVLVTAHQGFFTEEALDNIAETTLANVTAFETGEGDLHQVTTRQMV